MILIFIGCVAAFMQAWASASFPAPTSASILLSVLGGPVVTYGPLGLVEESGWTWLLVVGVFAVAAGMSDELGSPNWNMVGIGRFGTCYLWISSKLIASGISSIAYVLLLGISWDIAITLHGARSAFIDGKDVLYLVMVCIMFISIGWTKIWIQMTRYRTLASLVVLLLLADAAFGGQMAPVVPFAQAIYGLHGLPGTMTRIVGGAYLFGWTVASGVMAICWAPLRARTEWDRAQGELL